MSVNFKRTSYLSFLDVVLHVVPSLNQRTFALARHCGQSSTYNARHNHQDEVQKEAKRNEVPVIIVRYRRPHG